MCINKKLLTYKFIGEIMDKSKEIGANLNHAVQINERQSIVLTGVKKLDNFDSKEFFLDSVMGYVLIKGEGLELIKLDTFQGTLSIKGKINSLNYLESEGKKPFKEGMISKLFK